MSNTPLQNDAGLDEIIAEFLEAEELGRPVPPERVIGQHPEFAEELRNFFADRDLLRSAARPLADAVVARRPVLGKIRYFGDYELLEEIARGGMGVVYKARQVSLNRVVAVKMILAGNLASEVDVHRFQIEAEAAARLQHPNIVAVHEVGRQDGQSYFSMDYVDGRNLSEIVREDPLSMRQVAKYVAEIAAAVHYAHQQGTLHRDLKPSNVMIDVDDRVRITDFGLALNIESDSKLTGSGQALGTPAYMPPEQAQGKRGLIGPTSDVYSLGAILYELLTGRPPFRGESPVATIRQVVDSEPLAPRLLNPAVPADLETICLKCLQKEPHQRYATARFLGDDLQRFLEGRPILARPIGRIARLWRWCRRKPLPAALGAALALTILGLVIVLAVANVLIGGALQERTEALAEAKTQQRATEKALQEKGIALTARQKALFDLDAANTRLKNEIERGRWQFYVRSIQLAQHEVQLGNLEAARRLLDQCGPDVLRSFEWHYLNGLCRDRLRSQWNIRVTRAPRPFTRTGRIVAAVDGQVHVYDAVRQRVVDRFPLPRFRYVSAVSPDGRWLAVVTSSRERNGEIDILQIPGGRLHRTIHLNSAKARAVSFSADGRQIAVVVDHLVVHLEGGGRRSAQKSAEFAVWDVASGRKVRSSLPQDLKPGARQIERHHFDIGDDLRLLMTPTGIIDTVTQKTVIGFEQPAVAHAFNRDSTLAAVGTAAGQVTVWDVPARRARATWFVPAARIRFLAFRPDDRAVAIACNDGSVRFRSVADGQPQVPLRTGSPVSHVAFSPDGCHMMTANFPRRGFTAFRVWEAERRPALVLKGVQTLLGFPGSIAAVSPDGRLVAAMAVGADCSVLLFDAINGEIVRRLPGTKRRTAVAFSHDGKLMAFCNRDGFSVWDVDSGRLQRVFRPSVGTYCTQPAFSPDGKYLAGAHEAGATVWDLRTGREVKRFRSRGRYFSSLQFSGDGRFLCATGERRGGCIWNVPDWTQRCRLARAHATPVALSPDNALLATAGAGGIALTDTQTGKRERTIPLRELARTVDFSPDGKRLVTTAGSRILILDRKTGERVLTLSGHRGRVSAVAFSRDGRRILSAGIDGTVRLWGEPPRLRGAVATPAQDRTPVLAPKPRR
jgi:WD40 repeat protein/tRNA A-37 threonylcarbamoyl transferase component Bud32